MQTFTSPSVSHESLTFLAHSHSGQEGRKQDYLLKTIIARGSNPGQSNLGGLPCPLGCPVGLQVVSAKTRRRSNLTFSCTKQLWWSSVTIGRGRTEKALRKRCRLLFMRASETWDDFVTWRHRPFCQKELENKFSRIPFSARDRFRPERR